MKHASYQINKILCIWKQISGVSRREFQTLLLGVHPELYSRILVKHFHLYLFIYFGKLV